MGYYENLSQYVLTILTDTGSFDRIWHTLKTPAEANYKKRFEQNLFSVDFLNQLWLCFARIGKWLAFFAP